MKLFSLSNEEQLSFVRATHEPEKHLFVVWTTIRLSIAWTLTDSNEQIIRYADKADWNFLLLLDSVKISGQDNFSSAFQKTSWTYYLVLSNCYQCPDMLWHEKGQTSPSNLLFSSFIFIIFYSFLQTTRRIFSWYQSAKPFMQYLYALLISPLGLFVGRNSKDDYEHHVNQLCVSRNWRQP